MNVGLMGFETTWGWVIAWTIPLRIMNQIFINQNMTKIWLEIILKDINNAPQGFVEKYVLKMTVCSFLYIYIDLFLNIIVSVIFAN